MITTNAFANAIGLKPQSLHASLCRNGSYYGIRPIILPNGRLGWPDDAVDQLLNVKPKKGAHETR